MRTLFLKSLPLFFVLILSGEVLAADNTHGDACTNVGALHTTNDAAGVDILICNGTNWQTVLSYPSAGNLLRLDNDPLAGSQGCIRYNGTTSRIEYSDDCLTFIEFNGSGGAADNDWVNDNANSRVYNTTNSIGVGTSIPLQEFDASSLLLDAGAGNCPSGYTQGDFDGEADGADCRLIGLTVDTATGSVGINTSTNTNGRLNIIGNDNNSADTLIFLEDDRSALIQFEGGINSDSAGLSFANSSSAQQFYFGLSGGAGNILKLTSNQSAGRTVQFGDNIDWIDFNQDNVLVAIGEDTAEAHLEVSASGGTTGNLMLLSSNDDNDGDIMTVLENGHVGIGIIAPNVALDVNGDINFTGVIADVSDERLKDDITPLLNALEKIMQLKGVSFVMKEDPASTIELGLIAQDVEKVYPELIQENDDGIKRLNYIGMIGPLVESIKELNTKNNTLEFKLENLMKRVEALESQ